MDQPRSGATATLLSDGQVLLIGGESAGYTVGTALLYQPATGVWLTSSGMLRYPRAAHVAVQLLDGNVVVAGGSGVRNFQTVVSAAAEGYRVPTGSP